ELGVADLSPRQMQILTEINRSIQGRGYPPTIQELQAAFGADSPGFISRQISRLHELGYLDREVATWRGLRVTELGAEHLLRCVDTVSYAVLAVVRDMVQQAGYGPSLREIQDVSGLRFHQVRKCMGRLEAAGMVARPL